MHLRFLEEIFQRHHEEDAIVWRGETYTYGYLVKELQGWRDRLARERVPQRCVVALEADFSPNSISALLALVDGGAIVVPLAPAVEVKKESFCSIAQVEYRVRIDCDERVTILPTGVEATHDLLVQLKSKGHPGLVLFSSGSTGESKAALHDFVPLLEKFRVRRNTQRAISFLLFDHIGGVNTLLYSLSNAGCLIAVEERSASAVCRAIEQFGAEVLPTSPTFLNLLMVSEAYRRYDLSSLKLITYGTEPMPESTLERLCRVFPQVRLLQTYGLSELGILRSKSLASDSLWVRVGGEGFETRVVDNRLEIRAKSAMLGYLNAPSPFSDDGWFDTGDLVEVDGEFLRFLGRESEVINVGGEKVYPLEVENIIQQMEGVEDVSVEGEQHPLIGEIVRARVKLATRETAQEFRKRMNRVCRRKLERFKIPQRVSVVTQSLHGERFKKQRRSQSVQ